jgi:hypothetical protein
MTIHAAKERYGLRRVLVENVSNVSFEGRPLTEEDKEWDREADRIAKLAEEYNKSCQELSDLLDDKIFLAETLGYIISMITGEKFVSSQHNLEYGEINGPLPLSERIRIINTRKADASLSYSVDLQTLRTLHKALLAGHFDLPRDFPEPDTPEVLYRVFRQSCYGRHDKNLGFRSSRQPLTPPDLYAYVLDTGPLTDEEWLPKECEGNQPSDLIALSDSPSRIFDLVQSWDPSEREGDVVAVINVSKLLALDVAFNRTTTLNESLHADSATGNISNGLQFANSNDWVAYRWIPAECIERYTSIHSLRRACKFRGIGM